ncbi:hypothetical protein FALCPG4_007286 [Fusarium falciforme]
MASNPDIFICTICGIDLCWPIPPDSISSTVCLRGPHWPPWLGSHPQSLDLPDDAVRRFIAGKDEQLPQLNLLPDRQWVLPQVKWPPGQSDASAQLATWQLYVGIHPACEELANRVMETSFNARIRSLGDLWMTLERRCARRDPERESPSYNFLPYIPTSQPGKALSFTTDRYFVPFPCIVRFGDEWEGWWAHNPINIPDLTTQLISNLEPISRATTTMLLSNSTQEFKGRLAALPPEILNKLVPWFQIGTMSLDCNYIMPQSLWKQIFFQIPFLWDLDTEQVLNKTCSEPSETEEWNWEKITRQVLSPAQPSDRAYEGDEKGYLWSHETVGLHVPPGFTNRRRIWQILEEMWPNDVGIGSDSWPVDHDFKKDVWEDDECLELGL